jgi:hypothetical protein
MSRSTQFIGLTARGAAFVDGLESALSDKHTAGMFDETIPLRRWMAPEGLIRKVIFVQEVVQEVREMPWSSGSMIFTCLEIEYHGDDQMFTAPCFEWVHDSVVLGEFDYDSGVFWIQFSEKH